MAINKLAVGQTQIYKQALSAEEKKRMQTDPASRKDQTQELLERGRVLSSGDTQAITQMLRQENLQRAADKGAAGAAQMAANLQYSSVMNNGTQAQKNEYLRQQAKTLTADRAAPAAASAAPVQMKDYTWWNWMGSNDMTTMTDEDRAKWNTAMRGYQNGDYRAYNDLFQTAGNWSSYVDENGNVSGMLRYVGDGVGGYLPVNNGRLLDFRQGDDLSNIAFYGPGGEVYTVGADGRLARTGTWTQQTGAPEGAPPHAMDKKTLEWWNSQERQDNLREAEAYEDRMGGISGAGRTPAGQTPAQQAISQYDRQSSDRAGPAANAGTVSQDIRPVQAQDRQVTAEYPKTDPYRADLEPWAYEPAPEWEGSDYQRRRDETLRRAEDMRWSYDPDADPAWEAYRKQYRREGRRASQDALGQYAAMTGGVPSSYAMTAASQAGDYYAAKLSDKLPELYQNAYDRYLQEYQRQLGVSDRYAQFDEAEYDRYRDRLGQWNTDRSFDYDRYRDAVEDARYADETAYDRAWNEENRDYARDYQARRDAINDARYDQEWAQELREYADAQGWKALDWQQYLREYGDQLSQQEREWVYRQARDAESDRRYAQEYADAREQTAYQRSQAADKQEYERGRDALSDQRYDTQWQQSLREYEDEREQQAWNNAYKMLTTFGSIVTQDMADALGMPLGTTLEQYRAATGSSGGSGRSSGSSKTEAASGSRYDERGRRTGVWKDADGYTYNGYHPDGQWRSQGYDAAWVSVQSLAQAGAGKEKVLTKIRDLVEQDKITDYEAEMMLANLGYHSVSAGTGRNTIGPDSVQMVQ